MGAADYRLTINPQNGDRTYKFFEAQEDLLKTWVYLNAVLVGPTPYDDAPTYRKLRLDKITVDGLYIESLFAQGIDGPEVIPNPPGDTRFRYLPGTYTIPQNRRVVVRASGFINAAGQGFVHVFSLPF